MKCNYAKLFIHDYVDGYLADEQQSIIESHILECAECKSEVRAFKQQKLALSELPTPELTFDTLMFAENVTNIAEKKYSPEKNGVGSTVSLSIAASLLLSVIVGLLFIGEKPNATPVEFHPNNEIFTINEQKKNFNLVFNSPKALNNVTFTVILPDDTELAGHPGEKQVIWTAQLIQGRNILTLPVISSNQNENELIITKINYADNSKVFEIELNAKRSKQIT